MELLVTLAGVGFVAALFSGLALVLRRWHWELHTELSDLRREVERSSNAVIERLTSSTRESVELANREVLNAVGLTALDFSYPVMLGGPSIDGHHARTLLFLLQQHKPRRILELGSGSSTVLIARALLKLGHPAELHVSVDHDARYLRLTRELARLNGVEHLIRFEHCPLESRPEWAHPWYSRIAEVAADAKFDLLLVDGPPAYESGKDRAREPALDVLAESLGPNAIVLLDDANRPGETAIAEAWCARHPGFAHTRIYEGKGVAIFSLGAR